MAELNPMQMIFTRVEANYSPHRKSGYQTVYHSSGLSASDVKEIEKHVQCFQTNEPSLVRQQFFTLQSGYVVVTHTITIETIAEIVDKYQRGGVFLAHCLIFSKKQFEKADNNPFQIFDAFHNFMDNAPDMIAQFNQAQGREPRCTINIATPQRWGRSSPKLAELIEKNSQKNKSLLFYGTEKEIDNALRTAFDLTAKEKRLTRTFNSHIDRCMIRPGTYWAVGASSRQSGPYIPIHASLRKGEGSGARVVRARTHQVKAEKKNVVHKIKEVIEEPPAIQELKEAFNQRRHLNHSLLNEEACHSYFALHEERIIQALHSALSQATSENLGILLAKYLLNEPKKVLLDIAASQSPDLTELALRIEALLIAQAPEFERLKNDDWRAVQQLARQVQNNTLLFWAAALGQDKKSQQEALRKMNEDEFKKALLLMFNPIPPVEFVVRGYSLRYLFDKLGGEQFRLQDHEFVEFVKAIIAVKGIYFLNKLIAPILDLENKPLTQLEEELEKLPYVPKEFAEAVKKRRTQLGKPAKLHSRLYTWYKKIRRS